jgi:energy-coupling factor transporter ATP-binding protein EcfA2
MTSEAPVIEAFVDMIRARLADDHDEVIVIEGYEGSGKSSLAWWLAQVIDPHFSGKNMVLSAVDLIKLARTLPKGRVIVWDETIEGGFSRDAMTKENKAATKWMTVSRARCLCVILVMPDARWMDVLLREHRVRWKFDVKERGTAAVLAPAGVNPDGSKAWQPVHYFRYPKPIGADWDAYYTRKMALIEKISEAV